MDTTQLMDIKERVERAEYRVDVRAVAEAIVERISVRSIAAAPAASHTVRSRARDRRAAERRPGGAAPTRRTRGRTR